MVDSLKPLFAQLRLCVLILLLTCMLRPANAQLTKDSSVDEILDALHARGKDLKSFVCDVSMTETDLATGDAPVRSGKVWFQMKGENDGRIRVEFDKVKREEDPEPKKQQIVYILDNGKLVERNYDPRKKSQATHQVLKPGEKLNLLKLGEGPFPLPIGQPKDDVKRLFEVTKIPPGKDEPSDTVHVKLSPLPDTQFSRKFKFIDVWIDAQNMPTRILTEDNTTERDTRLENIQLNPSLSDQDFELENIDLKGWNVTEDSFQK